MTGGARLPPVDLPGLDPAWSRLVPVISFDGVRRTWHVLDNGVPDPELTLLCLHGNPTWSYLWRELLAAVPARWRVVAPDHLGMGYSERLSAPRSFARRVSDLGELTAELGVVGPTVTVAHDWGGPISLGWAHEHRQQLCGLVLTNTAVQLPRGNAGPALIRLASTSLLREAVCSRTPMFVRGATALSRPALRAEVRDAFAAPYAAAARRRSVADFVADIPFGKHHPSRAALDTVADNTRSLDVPALLLWGPRDPVFGQRFLDDLRDRLPHADVHRFEGASHLVSEDAPEYAAAVVQWVSDLEAVPGRADDTRDAALDRPGDDLRSSLGKGLENRAWDRSPAVVEVGGRTVSWELLERRVREISSGLLASGVTRGQRVALLVPPSVDLTAAVYAIWRAGGVIVVADKGLGVGGMGRALRGARVDHVIASAQGLAAARAMRLPGTRIGAGTVPRGILRALGARLTLGDLARMGRASPRSGGATQDDECAVVFTSGATGPAKGVVYLHRQVEAQLELVRSTYGLTADDRIVAAFAPFSLYGPALGIGSAVPNTDVTSPGTLTATALAEAVDAISATVVFASPAALRNAVATASALTASQLSALAGVRLVMSAGAPVPTTLLRAVLRLLPQADAHTPYGMTEMLPVTDVSLAQIEAAGPGEGVCVGRPLPGVDVALRPLSVFAETRPMLTGEAERTGEVCVRGPHAKERYDALWATQRASAAIPGWHRTGDVGHLDAEGRLWIEGRLQHLIATTGGVVTPVGIEQRVEALDGVESAAAVGIGPVGTQQVALVVVGEDSRDRVASTSPVATLTLTEAVRRVAGVEVAAVLVADSLPVDIRHASKIDRRRVGDWASHVLAGGSTSRRTW